MWRQHHINWGCWYAKIETKMPHKDRLHPVTSKDASEAVDFQENKETIFRKLGVKQKINFCK